jgi:uncharacterized protein (DUF1697 family)
MTSKRFIALLRGVNVGRAKRIAMADLRTVVTELGYTAVRSVLNSGNVVFSAAGITPAAAAAALEEALVLKLGVAARVMVLACDDLARIVADNPLLQLATDDSRLLVFILAEPALTTVLEPLVAQDWAPGALAVGERAAYVWCPDGVLDSAAAAAVGKHLGDNTTFRNWSTLKKLHALCADASS